MEALRRFWRWLTRRRPEAPPQKSATREPVWERVVPPARPSEDKAAAEPEPAPEALPTKPAASEEPPRETAAAVETPAPSPSGERAQEENVKEAVTIEEDHPPMDSSTASRPDQTNDGFVEAEEVFVDLEAIDEDMQAIETRALGGRGRSVLSPMPLDALARRWRAALDSPDRVWALFKHGTIILFEAKPRDAEAEARATLAAHGVSRYGGLSSEYDVRPSPRGGGWIVGGSTPEVMTYVAPEEAGATTPLHVIGRLGRAKRDEDARELVVAHIENDPDWRPPED